MQFILIAYDGTDPGALERRMMVREEHLRRIDDLRKKGHFITGGAILDNEGRMTGSMILYDYPDKLFLEMQLKEEPYFTEGVWERIEIHPFRIAKF